MHITYVMSKNITVKHSTPETLVSYCDSVDGSRKAELHRKPVTNPLTQQWLGEWSWEVWTDADPECVVRFMDEEKARKAFRNAMVFGTNGFGDL